MKGRKLAWLLFLLITTETIAKEISGKVTDAEDQSPIIGAHVILKNSSPVLGGITDINGEFSIAMPQQEELVLQVSYVGYKKKEISLSFSVDLMDKVSIHLEADMLEDIIITASSDPEPINEFAEVSSKFISMKEADKMPGGFNDIGRMAQNFSGVQKSDDASNEIVVRGNNPGSVLWRIEGIDVPNPNHFAELGTSGGPLSLLNTNTIQDSDFYTGAFPAEYGNATGAAFDIRLKNGNKERIRYMGQLGFNGIEAMAEGPIKRGSDATFFINYRNSNLTLIEKMNLIDFDVHLGVPTFNDLAFKANIPTGKFGQFSVFGITGKSDVSTEASRIIRKENATEEAKLKAKDEGKDEHYGSLSGIYGLKHQYLLNEKTWIESSLSYTRSDAYVNIDTLDKSYDPHRQYEQSFLENRFAIRSKLNHRINDQQLLSTGFAYTHLLYNFEQSMFFPDLNAFGKIAEEDGNAALIQSFLQYKYQTKDKKLSVSPGLHYQHFAYNNTFAIEPRLSVAYHLNDAHNLTLGLGKHSQLLPINVYFQHAAAQETSTHSHKLDLQKSMHYVLGHQWMINDKFNLNSEIYYQSLYNIPVSYGVFNSWSMVNGINSEFNGNQPLSLVDEGLGRNYGLDISMEYADDRGWHGMINTSLFQSKYTGSDGIWRNTTWNGNYLLNAIIGKNLELGKHQLNFNLKTNWTGGRRYTPIDLEASREQGRTVRHEDKAFSVSYPDYFKMDFRVGYLIPAGKTKHEIALDFQNITNRKNVFYQTYSPSSKKIKTVHQLEFFPVFQYRIFF